VHPSLDNDQTVEHDSGGGAWWHITSPYIGYVLGQYFC
jgi:hypothetical protein